MESVRLDLCHGVSIHSRIRLDVIGGPPGGMTMPLLQPYFGMEGSFL